MENHIDKWQETIDKMIASIEECRAIINEEINNLEDG